MKICKECGGNFRYNVVSDRRSGSKYLRSGCCDLALRPCPNPKDLARSLHITEDERDYLNELISQPYFGGKAVAMILQIESKIQQAEVKASSGGEA